ncbi:hypothetical protein [Piscirickettsia salmonis]|nr:hypothetical protein [Piscirickettsia salmonis]
MKETQQDYRELMFDGLSQLIEDLGKEDVDYDDYQKSEDILEVLEGLLAYGIYNTSIDAETIRDSCEESYVHIKRKALMMYRRNSE